MGCASSSPLVESGKNFVDTAKDQAGEVVSKGEKTIHGKSTQCYILFVLKTVL